MNRYLNAVKMSAEVLPNGDKKKIIAVSAVQISLSLLDLAGVALIGIIGALSVSGIQSVKPGNKTSKILELLHIGSISFYSQIIALSGLALFFLIGKTIISMYFTRKYLLFLSRRSSYITSTLFSKFLSQNILKVQDRNSQESLFQLTEGVRRITTGILGNFVFLISDISLLIVMTIGLLVIDPIAAVISFVLFGMVAALLHIKMSSKSRVLGHTNASLSIKGNKTIIESIASYRENLIRNRRQYFVRELSQNRDELARTEAELAFLPMISKYILESAVIAGAFVIAGLQFAINDSRHAIAALAIFMAAGSRIGPALLRVQQGVIQIGIAIGSVSSTFKLIEELKDISALEESDDVFRLEHNGFNPGVEICSLSFAYGDQQELSICNVNLSVRPGQTVAIVGSSGAGKSTLVDLILGVLDPASGEILISGENPRFVYKKWPGAISYVPQEISLVEGTIRENICLGYPATAISENVIWNSIDLASLRNFVVNTENGLETQIGELGSRISGGERQRIGIARALISNPQLLILDEATSSLDGETEAQISKSIQEMKGKITIIMIAHRLSTVREADIVIYLDKGKVKAQGSFDEVRLAIPDFDTQAKLMGL